MNEITSRDNQHLKFAKAVRDGRERDWIFIEGLRLAEEAIRSACLVNKCFVTRSFLDTARGDELVQGFTGTETEILLVSDTLLRSIADTENPQGIIAIAERPTGGREAIEAQLSGKGLKLVLLLHEINNPSNLGAVLRTAEAAGAAGVITTTGSSDAFSPKSIRASMGSAFRLPVWENVDISYVFEWAEKVELRTTALDIGGRRSIYEVDWRQQRLLIAGSEAHGLESDILAKTDETLNIPMASPVESLNLAVSCGITLFEARRQNGE
jgi:TrmH family RNA methyltransferase